MNDMKPNIPEVVDEGRERFEAYEQAIIDKGVQMLDTTFWNCPLTIRLATHQG